MESFVRLSDCKTAHYQVPTVFLEEAKGAASATGKNYALLDRSCIDDPSNQGFSTGLTNVCNDVSKGDADFLLLVD
jgi:hypothetical protein